MITSSQSKVSIPRRGRYNTLMNNRGYMVRLYGGQEVYVESMKDLRLLVEAKLESPLYLAEEGKFVPTSLILEHMTGTISYTEVTGLNEAESIEFSLNPRSIKELFNFKIEILGDRIKASVMEKPKKLKKRRKKVH